MAEQKIAGQIGFSSVILMILTSCLGIRWIPVAGGIGTPALLFWLLGIILLFIPLMIMIVECSLNYSKDGGVYLWVKEGLGPKAGFLTSWFYWTNNIFYYPALLTFMAANLAYLINHKSLASNHYFVATVVIVSFWFIIGLNLLGVKNLARIASFGGVLNLGLVSFIIVSGIAYVMINHTPATPFELANLIPSGNAMDNISNLALLMFALGGLELIPTLAQSVKNPQRTLPISLVISGFILVAMYMLGTLCINFILTPNELSSTTGAVDALLTVSAKLHLDFLIKIIITALVIVEFFGVSIWLIAPTIMFFKCSEPGSLPDWLQKLNRNYVPKNALILQGIIVTAMVILTQFLPTVNAMYITLALMTTIVYFLPYLFLSVAYLSLRKKGLLPKTIVNNTVAKLVAILGFLSVLFGIIISFVPGSDLKTTSDIIVYELELFGGPIIFVIMGFMIYARRDYVQKKNARV
jgi:amino acid transporter